jgi:outer membrane protein OmpA-like peptidoglycan-associated protein
VPAPAAAAGLGVAGFEWNGAKLVLSGKVPDEATRKAIVDQAIAALGADAVTDRLVVDAAAGVPAWQTHLAALLDWGRAKGVHGLAIDGQTVVLTGEVGTEAERAERVAFARTLFGAGTTIDDRMTVAAAASPAPATAQAASAAAPAAAPEPPPTSAKLYFATGSHALPADAAAATAALVEYAVAHPASKVVVSGFHDRTGRRDANELLAKNRAFATRDLLVRAGVPAERIDLVKPQVVDGGADLREARRVEVAIAR